jgi:putative DNA primase/helicase
MYIDEGPNEGIYTTSEIDLMKVARRFNRRLAKKDFEEVLFTLKTLVDRTERCVNRDLIPVNNGIFDYDTKQLLPFTPDRVFLAKSHIDYNPLAQNVTIHNDDDGTDWDLVSWIHEISDDSDIETLLWQIMGAVIRPYVRWNKSAWFYAEDGNNGKGTFCEMMQNLCGDGTYASIPIINFGKDFMLEPLIHSTAIIVHENATGKFIDDVANLKAVITNDVIPINRKHKQPINFQFYGFMVQCLNEMPRIRDKSDSFYRRQLFVPFSKSYTGIERKYIKDDYIKRVEVLEYALYRVLNMNYYELSEPISCRQVLEEYKEYNDPVRQFMGEFSDQFKWDLLPFQFLYDLYKAWFKRNIPSGTLQSKSKFIQEILNVIKKSNQWYCRDKNKNIRSDKRIVGPEPLIFDYELTDWYNKTYKGSDPVVISTFHPNQFYRGILRVSSQATAPDDTADGTEVET